MGSYWSLGRPGNLRSRWGNRALVVGRIRGDGDRAGLPRPDLSGPDGFAALSDRLAHALDLLPGERFDALVVDEAQDMREGWWTALQLCLTDPDNGIIYAFRDDAQRLRHPEETAGETGLAGDAPELPSMSSTRTSAIRGRSTSSLRGSAQGVRPSARDLKVRRSNSWSCAARTRQPRLWAAPYTG